MYKSLENSLTKPFTTFIQISKCFYAFFHAQINTQSFKYAEAMESKTIKPTIDQEFEQNNQKLYEQTIHRKLLESY